MRPALEHSKPVGDKKAPFLEPVEDTDEQEVVEPTDAAAALTLAGAVPSCENTVIVGI